MKYITENFFIEAASEQIENIANQVYDEIDEISKQAVSAFYDDYSPTQYVRKKDLYNLWTGSKRKVGSGYIVTYEYDPKLLKQHEDHKSRVGIFNNSFLEGYHGGEFAWGRLKSYVPRTIPSIWDNICINVEELEDQY